MLKIIATTLLALSLSAAALAAPRLQIANITTGGGFTRVPTTVVIAVATDGVITRQVNDEPVTFIAKLSASKLVSLKKLIDAARASELVLVDPSAGECSDAPSTTFNVTTVFGKQFAVAGRYGCRDYMLKDMPAYDLVRQLRAIKNLAD